MEIGSGSGACARDAPDESSTPAHARLAKNLFMPLLPYPMLSVIFSQAEQAPRKAAIDGGALAVGKFGFRDNFQRREIADRERHVRTHHDPFRANDVGQIAQRAAIN